MSNSVVVSGLTCVVVCFSVNLIVSPLLVVFFFSSVPLFKSSGGVSGIRPMKRNETVVVLVWAIVGPDPGHEESRQVSGRTRVLYQVSGWFSGILDGW